MADQGSSWDFSSFELWSQMTRHYPWLLSPLDGMTGSIVVSNKHLLQGWQCVYSYTPLPTLMVLVCPQSVHRSPLRCKKTLTSKQVKLLCSGRWRDLIVRAMRGVRTPLSDDVLSLIMGFFPWSTSQFLWISHVFCTDDYNPGLPAVRIKQ